MIKRVNYLVSASLLIYSMAFGGVSPSKTGINLGGVPIDKYLEKNWNGSIPYVTTCSALLTVKECMERAFKAGYTNSWVPQDVTGVRFFFALGGGWGSTPFTTSGAVNGAWVTNLRMFFDDLKSWGIQEITPTPILIANWSGTSRQCDGCQSLKPSDPPTPNCAGSGSMVFYRWLPFGLDPLDSNLPDRSCTNQSYNNSNPNPDFWGWQPFLNLVDAILDQASQAGLDVAEFDYGNEINVASFTVEARLLYDNKSSPPFDVLEAIRTRMTNHWFQPGRATASVQMNLPTTAGYNCQSFWGDSAMILHESALSGALAGSWGVFGMPPISWHNNLPCIQDNPAIQYDTSNMVSLPHYYAQPPTVTDVHASIKVGNSDITSTAKNLYNGLWGYLVYRGLTGNYVVIGETNPVEVYDCGDGLTVQRANENVAGYLTSTLYQNHDSQTMLRPWHDSKSGSCDPTPNVLKPPYGN